MFLLLKLHKACQPLLDLPVLNDDLGQIVVAGQILQYLCGMHPHLMTVPVDARA